MLLDVDRKCVNGFEAKKDLTDLLRSSVDLGQAIYCLRLTLKNVSGACLQTRAFDWAPV